jgi:hypothetical protein
MKNVSNICDFSDMRDRIGQFLYDFTAPLFSPMERVAMHSQFNDMAKTCFHSNDSSDWNSELCVGGIPMEFALAIDDSASMSLRYVTDPQCRPGNLAEATRSRKNLQSVTAPSSGPASELLERLFRQHLVDTGHSPKTYFVHGFRFSPGQKSTYRVYFNTEWRKRSDVFKILNEYLQPDNMRALSLPSLAALDFAGVAYDVLDDGLGNMKLYMLVKGDHRERISRITDDLLGHRSRGMDELYEIVSSIRGNNWKVPPIVLGITVAPQGAYREVKFCLLTFPWEWNRFSDLEPVITSILDRWRFPECVEFPAVNETCYRPLWRFMPNHVSLGVSPTRESLSVYFQPARAEEIGTTLGIHEATISENHRCDIHSRDTLDDRARAFRTMFGTLVKAEI